MSEFSTTRIADFEAALTNNVHLQPAISWLKTMTALNRLSDIEIYEALQAATVNEDFAITFGGNAVP